MINLSRSSRAVIEGYANAAWDQDINLVAIAGAIRAVADSVAPDDYKCFTGNIEWDAGMEARTDCIRENLLHIAAELETFVATED